MDGERLIQIALECGATKAAIVTQKDIVLNAAFRGMCEANRCGVYGRCYMCPPDVGPIDELMARVRGYERGLLYQTISPLEDSFDIEGMQAAKKAFDAIPGKIKRRIVAYTPRKIKTAFCICQRICKKKRWPIFSLNFHNFAE